MNDPERILSSLSPLQAGTLSACLDHVRLTGFFSVAVHGSIAYGDADELSDIDLTLAYDSSSSRSFASDELSSLVGRMGTRLLEFDANHIGAANASIYYLQRGVDLIKVDISLWATHEIQALPRKSLILFDEANRFVHVALESITTLDDEVLFRKLIGWLWFVYVRIARGEYFAAARAIDYSREQALLPIMLNRLGLPNDGHRRLEARLPIRELQMLQRTYSKKVDRPALMKALTRMNDVVRFELLRTRPRDEKLASALQEVEEQIARAERRFVGEGSSSSSGRIKPRDVAITNNV